eukprot:363938-Chlamydomonas_euryale.AAC.4
MSALSTALATQQAELLQRLASNVLGAAAAALRCTWAARTGSTCGRHAAKDAGSGHAARSNPE